MTLGKEASANGGGKTYLIFSLALNSSNLELHIPNGATIKVSNDFDAWKGHTFCLLLLVDHKQA